MKKEFYINIIFLILANLMIKPMYLLWIDIKVQNIVGPSTYGLYLSLFSLCYILQIIADPGLLNYNTTFISGNRGRLQDRFGVMLSLKLTLSICFLLVIALTAKVIGYPAEVYPMLKWIAVNVGLLSMLLYLRSNVSSMGFYRWDSFFSILDKTVLILICYYLIYVSPDREDFQIQWFIYAQTVSLAITVMTLMLFTHFKAVKLSLRFDFSYFKKILKKSMPFAWLLFFMTIYTRIDSFMLERLLSDDAYEAGIYASVFRLYDAGNSFAYLFGVLLLPMFSNILSEKRDVFDLLKNSAHLMWVLITSGVMACLFWAEDIMSFFYDAYTNYYAQVFRLLMLGFIPMAMAYVYGSLLTAKKELRKLNLMAGGGVILNIVLNYYLINIYQAEGAAWATLGTQSVMLGVQIYFVFQIFDRKINFGVLLRFLLFLMVSIGLTYMIKIYSPIHFWINFVIAIIISIFAALIFQVLPIKSLQRLLMKNLESKT